MTTHTITTTTGHHIDVSCWTGSGLNFQIHIDGQFYTDGTSFIGAGDTDQTEAEHQATQTAKQIENSELQHINGEWQMANTL